MKASRLPVAVAATLTRMAPALPVRPILPLAASAPLSSMLMLACKVAVCWRVASQRSDGASAGANRSVNAMTPFEIAGVEIDGDAAARRILGLDASAGDEAGVAQVADRQPLDGEPAGVHLEPRGDIAGVEAGDLGVPDLERPA